MRTKSELLRLLQFCYNNGCRLGPCWMEVERFPKSTVSSADNNFRIVPKLVFSSTEQVAHVYLHKYIRSHRRATKATLKKLMGATFESYSGEASLAHRTARACMYAAVLWYSTEIFKYGRYRKCHTNLQFAYLARNFSRLLNFRVCKIFTRYFIFNNISFLVSV